jgi:hypothetical protein
MRPYAMETRTRRGSRHRHRLHPSPVPDWATSRPIYRPRRPTATPLYPVIQHHLETFLDQATQSDPRGLGPPAWVERSLRAYLRCDILAHGFARAGAPAEGGSRGLRPRAARSPDSATRHTQASLPRRPCPNAKLRAARPACRLQNPRAPRPAPSTPGPKNSPSRKLSRPTIPWLSAHQGD